MRFLREIVLIISCIFGGWTANAQDWELTGAEANSHVWTLFVANGGTLFAATDDNLLRSTDEGQHWDVVLHLQPEFSGPPAGIFDIAELPDGTLLTAGTNGVYRSANNGITWSEVLPPPVRYSCFGSAFLGFTFVEASPSGQVFAVAREEEGGPCKISGRMYQSNDDGENWVQAVSHGNHAAAFDTNGNFYVGGGERFLGGIAHSPDYGVTWSPLFYLDAPVVSIVINEAGNVFAGTGGEEVFGLGEGTGIYRSTDEGATWHQKNTGLIDATISDLAIYPNGTLLAATFSGGVHRSTDNGESWHPLNSGLPSLEVTALAVDENGTAYAGTNEGIYRSTQPIATEADHTSDIPEEFQLEPNYPNPFNPTTTISYSLPVSATVNLRVYDALGKEVAIFVQGNRPAGEHMVRFDATNLPSGTYFYQLEANTFSKTGLMILAK